MYNRTMQMEEFQVLLENLQSDNVALRAEISRLQDLLEAQCIPDPDPYDDPPDSTVTQPVYRYHTSTE